MSPYLGLRTRRSADTAGLFISLPLPSQWVSSGVSSWPRVDWLAFGGGNDE
jgi:hypothetical protein